MSIQTSEKPASVVAFAPKKLRTDGTMVAEDAGHGIIALLYEAADMAKEDCARAMDLAHKLSFTLRAAEEKVRELEGRSIIFGTVPSVRKIGSNAFTMRSSRRSFRKRNTNSRQAREKEAEKPARRISNTDTSARV